MRVLDALRPHPHRGDLIAAGAVPLAAGLLMVDVRMTQWSDGAQLFVQAVGALLVLGMAQLARLEGDEPRAYHSVLLVAGHVLLATALLRLADVLGADHVGLSAGAVFWSMAVVAVSAGWSARRFNSAVCTLVAALAGGIAVLAFVRFAFNPHGVETFRWILLALTALYGGLSLRLREGRRRHAVQLVNVAGVSVLAVAVSLAVSGLVPSPYGAVPSSNAFGWKLLVLAVALGLIAYACVDREPGPGYVGFVDLVAFVVIAAHPAGVELSLVGWPLFLLLIGAAAIGAGLRPRAELPPEPPPPPGMGEAPTTQLHPQPPPPPSPPPPGPPGPPTQPHLAPPPDDA